MIYGSRMNTTEECKTGKDMRLVFGGAKVHLFDADREEGPRR
jgi:hypothetical protein